MRSWGEDLRLSEVVEDDFDLTDSEEPLTGIVARGLEFCHELGTEAHPLGQTIEGGYGCHVGAIEHGQFAFAHGARTHVFKIFFHKIDSFNGSLMMFHHSL